MPRLWSETVESHRRDVRAAILDTTEALVFEHGLRAVTMSRIAEETGIGRATLYKYFPDVDAILHAWHELQVAGHLHRLAEVRDRTGDPGARLEAVLEAYALSVHGTRRHRDPELAALLHGDEQIARARRQLHDLIRQVLAEAVTTGRVRDDVAPNELAGYCLNALAAAGSLPSRAAVHRLVTVTLAGLAPDGPSSVPPDYPPAR